DAAIRPDTALVSVMHANNEIGTVQDMGAIGALTRARGVLLHVDAAQSVGKIPVDMHAMQVDLLSVCAHKFHGPKGVGALCVRGRPPVRLQPQILGGGHERGLRSGTLATHQIVGLGTACTLAADTLTGESARLAGLRDALWSRLQQLPGVRLNGSLSHRLPGNLNVSIDGVEGESLLLALERVALSSGSACTSADLSPSHVLRAIGCTPEQAQGSLRISFGRFNGDADVEVAAVDIEQAVRRLRALAPDG
ncbi:MAG: aminotransferase class V-fold PLP-dependent enzyme, partial [Pseudomonadota bacterium]